MAGICTRNPGGTILWNTTTARVPAYMAVVGVRPEIALLSTVYRRSSLRVFVCTVGVGEELSTAMPL